jgi:next-to-BRCA1 protein 1
MHSECPDFDLCEGCEAHPIPVHPENHPLLKIKSPETSVANVHRRFSSLEEPTRGRPVKPVTRSRSSSRSSSRSFERGYMSNPSADNVRKQSPLPENVPPFPFFLGTAMPSPASQSQSDMGECYTPQPFIPSHSRSRSCSRSHSRVRSCIRSRSRSLSPRIWTPQATSVASRPASPTQWSAPADYSIYSRDPLSAAVPTAPLRMGNANYNSAEWRPMFEYLNPGQGNQPSAPSTLPTFPTPPRIPSPVSAAAVYRRPWIPSQTLDHLMHEAPSFISQSEPRFGSTQVASIGDAPAVPSPLNNEALLIRPNLDDLLREGEILSMTSTNRSLAALLHGYHSSPDLVSQATSTSTANDNESSMEILKEEEVVEIQQEPLTADFIADVTVPDGQTFPPGAEFVKCWRMINDSKQDWPESTELVFVAGVPLAKENRPHNVSVGAVKAGAEVDLWTGELKVCSRDVAQHTLLICLPQAPDFPGRYVGYWRLRDDKSQLFGNSIWVECVFSAHLFHDCQLTCHV